MPRRALASLFFACFAPGAALGCAQLFGIDDRPLVTDGGDEGSVIAPDGGVDGCAPGPGFCASFCPRPDFCDSFDEPSPEKRWNKGSVVSGGTLVETDDQAHGSAGNALFGHIAVDAGPDATADDSEGKGGGAFLVNAIDVGPEPARGLRAIYRVRLANIALDPIPFPDASLPGPAVVVGGFAEPGGSGLGLTSWFDPRRGIQVGFVYREATTTINASHPVIRFPAAPATMTALADGYTTVDVAMGPARVLGAHGLDCKDVPADAPFVVRGSILLTDCVAMPELASTPFLSKPVITAGTLLNGTGDITVAIDGVAVFVLR